MRRRRLRNERGFIDPFTITFLGWLAITSVLSTTIIGGSQVVASVQNKQTLDEAAAVARDTADILRQRHADNPTAMEMATNNEKMADQLQTEGNLGVWSNVSQTAYDAALAFVPMSKLTKVGKAAKFIWDTWGGSQLGQAALTAGDVFSKPPPDIVRIQEKFAPVTAAEAGSPEAIPAIERREAYILDAKAIAAQTGIEVLLPNSKLTRASSAQYKTLTWELAKTAVTDMAINEATAAAAGGDQEGAPLPAIGESPFQDTLATELELVDPSNKPTVGVGGIMLSAADKAALKSGEKDSVMGQYVGTGGVLVPVVVRKDETGALKTEFSLVKDAPAADTSSSLKPNVKEVPSFWDGSRSSCPFVYAYDGGELLPVNDIFSVSRDPRRAYVDNLLFGAAPGADGQLEVRVTEVRHEESFIDRIALRAIDVPDGYAAALSPGGRVYSVRDAAAAKAVRGDAGASLATADGKGVKGYDGVSVVAEFAAPGPGAVLLLTADGFEYDGSATRIVAKRPALRVAAFASGRWTPVGGAHPREFADTTAFDLAPFVHGGRVKVRVTSVSCDASVYQLIDRLALSSAPSGLAKVRTLSPTVTGSSSRTAALLASRDGKRAHLVPSQSLVFRLPDPGADAYVIQSVGWYRALGLR